MPERPVLSEQPSRQTKDNKPYVVFYEPDWDAVRGWYLTLEHELKAACLALGGSNQECKAE